MVDINCIQNHNQVRLDIVYVAVETECYRFHVYVNYVAPGMYMLGSPLLDRICQRKEVASNTSGAHSFVRYCFNRELSVLETIVFIYLEF